MRSICSSGIASSVVAPVVDDEMRRPSTSTSVWFAFAPRMNAPLTPARPPFIVISTPGWRCSSCARLSAPLRAISSALITVTSA